MRVSHLPYEPERRRRAASAVNELIAAAESQGVPIPELDPEATNRELEAFYKKLRTLVKLEKPRARYPRRSAPVGVCEKCGAAAESCEHSRGS